MDVNPSLFCVAEMELSEEIMDITTQLHRHYKKAVLLLTSIP